MTESLSLPPSRCGMYMCSKCERIDDQIEQLRGLISPGVDALSVAMIRCAIELLDADKAAVECRGGQRKLGYP